jgi:hypothetical protein
MMARSIATARATGYDNAVSMYNDLAMRLRGVPRHRINRAALREATEPVVEFLSDTVRLLERLVSQVSEPELRQALTEFQGGVRDLLSAFERTRS